MLDKYRKVSEDFELIVPELEQDGLVLSMTISSNDEGVYPMENGSYTGYPTMEEVETISLDEDVIEPDDPVMPKPQGCTTAGF